MCLHMYHTVVTLGSTTKQTTNSAGAGSTHLDVDACPQHRWQLIDGARRAHDLVVIVLDNITLVKELVADRALPRDDIHGAVGYVKHQRAAWGIRCTFSTRNADCRASGKQRPSELLFWHTCSALAHMSRLQSRQELISAQSRDTDNNATLNHSAETCKRAVKDLSLPGQLVQVTLDALAARLPLSSFFAAGHRRRRSDTVPQTPRLSQPQPSRRPQALPTERSRRFVPLGAPPICTTEKAPPARRRCAAPRAPVDAPRAPNTRVPTACIEMRRKPSAQAAHRAHSPASEARAHISCCRCVGAPRTALERPPLHPPAARQTTSCVLYVLCQ